ncbi:hypothetical protein [Ferrovum sp.]|uniref:hypothetical protein n=1 Tax=Ferrovum sp. TaxID=2609467 RepID=UPI00262D7B41|nr:hypothetical protein [Ferrovum sp.]
MTTKCQKYDECEYCVNADYDPDQCEECEDASNFSPEDDENGVEEMSYQEFIGMLKESAAPNVSEMNTVETMTIHEFAQHMAIAA